MVKLQYLHSHLIFNYLYKYQIKFYFKQKRIEDIFIFNFLKKKIIMLKNFLKNYIIIIL